MIATKEEVLSKVRLALVDALGVDEEEVTPGATCWRLGSRVHRLFGYRVPARKGV